MTRELKEGEVAVPVEVLRSAADSLRIAEFHGNADALRALLPTPPKAPSEMEIIHAFATLAVDDAATPLDVNIARRTAERYIASYEERQSGRHGPAKGDS